MSLRRPPTPANRRYGLGRHGLQASLTEVWRALEQASDQVCGGQHGCRHPVRQAWAAQRNPDNQRRCEQEGNEPFLIGMPRPSPALWDALRARPKCLRVVSLFLDHLVYRPKHRSPSHLGRTFEQLRSWVPVLCHLPMSPPFNATGMLHEHVVERPERVPSLVLTLYLCHAFRHWTEREANLAVTWEAVRDRHVNGPDCHFTLSEIVTAPLVALLIRSAIR